MKKYTYHITEQEIQDRASVSPRVTSTVIEAEIAREFYFTASDGVLGASEDAFARIDVDEGHTARALELLTFCVLVLRNGFTVTGESACANPQNFDAEIGRKIARQNAVNKVWPLLAFRLRDRLASV